MASIRHKSAAADPADAVYLDAARAVILAVGWSRTTLTDIARRAGVSRMTLYRRWPDMQTLLADVMTREWGSVVAAATELQDEHADPRQRLVRGIVSTVRALRANPLLRRIVELDPDRLLPYLLERRGRSQELLAGLLADLVTRGQDTGSVREGDPDVIARSLLLAAQGFTLSAHTMLDGRPRAEDADLSGYDDQLAELVERYLRP